MKHLFKTSTAEQRLLFVSRERSSESAERPDSFARLMKEFGNNIRQAYRSSVDAPGRESIRDAVRDTARELASIRQNLFTELRSSGLLPRLRNYVSLSARQGLSADGITWQPNRGMIYLNSEQYAGYQSDATDDELGYGYNVGDISDDTEASMMVADPDGFASLVSLSGDESDTPGLSSNLDSSVYIGPTGRFDSPMGLLNPAYAADYRRANRESGRQLAELSGRLQSLLSGMNGSASQPVVPASPYGTPGRNGFPPAPPLSPAADVDPSPANEPYGTPGTDGFPPAPPDTPAEARRTGTPGENGFPAAPTFTPEQAREMANEPARLRDELARRQTELKKLEEDVSRLDGSNPNALRDALAVLQRMRGEIQTITQRIEQLERGA